MRIKITKCTRGDYDYSELIGEEFIVEKTYEVDGYEYYKVFGISPYILKDDTITLEKMP